MKKKESGQLPFRSEVEKAAKVCFVTASMSTIGIGLEHFGS